MYKSLLLIYMFSTLAFSQNFNFDIHNTSLQEYIKMEENIGSEKLARTSNHVSFSGDAQPIIYLRKEEIIPDLMAYYYFKEKDSTMSYILYEWDVYNFEKIDNNQKSTEFENELIAKYKMLKRDIITKFGEPKTKSNFSNVARLTNDIFEESSSWNYNDSTSIELYISSSNYYEKKGYVTINPEHRIRLYIRNELKAKNTFPKLDSLKLLNLKIIVTNFFNVLESKDLIKIKEYLSDLIREKVTENQLFSLVDAIQFKRGFVLYYSGIQKGFDGSNYIMLNYKYADDKSNPPIEMIKLIIDDKDKIVGIQPIKLESKITD